VVEYYPSMSDSFGAHYRRLEFFTPPARFVSTLGCRQADLRPWHDIAATSPHYLDDTTLSGSRELPARAGGDELLFPRRADGNIAGTFRGACAEESSRHIFNGMRRQKPTSTIEDGEGISGNNNGAPSMSTSFLHLLLYSDRANGLYANRVALRSRRLRREEWRQHPEGFLRACWFMSS